MSDVRKPQPEDPWEAMKKAVQSILDLLQDSGLLPPPVPTDPRKRALHLRKHRNTGPDKPIKEQRRKR